MDGTDSRKVGIRKDQAEATLKIRRTRRRGTGTTCGESPGWIKAGGDLRFAGSSDVPEAAVAVESRLDVLPGVTRGSIDVVLGGPPAVVALAVALGVDPRAVVLVAQSSGRRSWRTWI